MERKLFIIIVTAVVVSSVATAGVTGQPRQNPDGSTTATDLDISSPSVDAKPTVSEPISVGSTVDIANVVPFESVSAEMTVDLKVDGTVVKSETVTVTEGETNDISVSYAFTESGEQNISIAGSVSFEGQELSAESPMTPITAYATLTGASFSVPESLEDEVDSVRSDIPDSLPSNVTVLAKSDALYLVFTNEVPESGSVETTGIVLNRTVEESGKTFGLLVASSATFETTGTETTVSDIAASPESFELDLVRVDAAQRRVAILTDPDEGNDLTVSTTAGVMSDDPVQVSDLFSDAAGKVTDIVLNSSVESHTGSVQSKVEQLVGKASESSLPTVGFDTAFWTDTNATVDAIVVLPGSEAAEFVAAFDPSNSSARAGDDPLLYRVEEAYSPRAVSGISEIKSNAEQLDGTVVSFTASVYQQRLSIQEALEHATGAPCDTTTVTVPTPNGPVCVNVVFDTLVHGGAAWTATSPRADDVMPIVGASSRHQDEVLTDRKGEYRIVGEIVTATRIDEELPDEPLLVVYELEKTGDLLDIEDRVEDLVKNESKALLEQFRDSVNETAKSGDETATNGTIAGTVVRQSGAVETDGTVLVSNTTAGIELNQPRDTLSQLAAAPPVGVTVAETNTTGEFAVQVPTGSYDVIAFNESAASEVQSVTVSEQPTTVSLSLSVPDSSIPPITGSNPPANVDDDPLLEDIDGNGQVDIFDALVYYNNRNSETIENNPKQFDFDGDGTPGTIFDALELYKDAS